VCRTTLQLHIAEFTSATAPLGRVVNLPDTFQVRATTPSLLDYCDYLENTSQEEIREIAYQVMGMFGPPK